MNQNARKDIKTLSGYEITDLEHITMTKARESWHIFGIISEFVQSAEQLAHIRPAVSIFGSARLKPDNIYCQTPVSALSPAAAQASWRRPIKAHLAVKANLSD